jgi:hypothetical protein
VLSEEYGDGTWTMIYDEGYIVEFPTATFNNYFMYMSDPDKKDEYLSICDRTLVGWYRGNDPHDHENWGCFTA